MSIISMFPGGAGETNSIPVFTYLDGSGNPAAYSLLDDGGGNWRIKFLSSGTLTITSGSVTVDAFMVGGGGAGGGFVSALGYGAGGGGGYTITGSGIILTRNTEYAVVIGAGGSTNSAAGGNTQAFNFEAPGGKGGGSASKGGNGASGGGGSGSIGGAGGSDGGNGVIGSGTFIFDGGTGQGSTTREFGDATGDLYAGGGGGNGRPGGAGGGAAADTAAADNTGGGGGAASGNATVGYAGGSGIVIIRNHREAA